MEQPYIVVTDAAADFVPGAAEQAGIEVIPMAVNMGDMSFLHYADYRNMTADVFYRKIREGAMPSTSQITPQDYLDFFTPVLARGQDILYIAFSSGMSGTYNSCRIALAELADDFPDRRICAIDSLGATGGEGLFALAAAENRAQGMSLEANADWCRENCLTFAYYWTVNDLMYLKKGGRVKAASAYFGTALNLKPVGNIDAEGHLPALYRVRGRQASFRKMAECFAENIVEPETQSVLICHSDCPEDAEQLKEVILKSGVTVREIRTASVGPVVGAHLGPGAVTLFYRAKKRNSAGNS